MLISKDEFWMILEERCKEPYTAGMINSISKLLPFGDKDDIMTDCYIHFIKEDCKRLAKIRNENGAKISITNKLRDIYRANKKRPKHIARIEDKYTDKENAALTGISYTDFQKRFCYFAIERTRNMASLNLGEKKGKDGRRSIVWLKKEMIAIVVKTDRKYRKQTGSSEFMDWMNLSEKDLALIMYLKSGSRTPNKFNVDRAIFAGKSDTPQRNMVNKLREIYKEMMRIIFERGDINSNQL